MNGKAIILSAPSGSGKTTIVRCLMEANPELSFSISATTRAPRGSERDGVDYHFLTPDQFRNKIDAGEFIEWEEVYQGTYYGTLRAAIEGIWAQGKNVIFDVDVKGGVNLKRFFGERALSVFVKAPSLDALRERLIARGTESPESLERRLRKAGDELAFEPQFDVTLVNDNKENACRKALELYGELKSRA